MKHSSRKKLNKWQIIGKILLVILYALIIAMAVWMFASWVDIIADNCEPNPSHYDWNFFIVMMDLTEPWRGVLY